jgi:5-formyltetrahydrofolate cyclo-ligase
VHEAVAEQERTQRETLRRRLRDERAALSNDAVSAASAVVCAAVAALPAFARAARVAAYAATRGEIDTATLAASGRLVYPRVRPATDLTCADELDFFALGPSALVPGRFGILEPPADAELVSPDAIDLILVPGVAFARDGHRLGFGRGFYDRFLARATHALRVGLAHDFQLVDQLPPRPGDEPVDLVLTPRDRVVTRARFSAPEEVLT